MGTVKRKKGLFLIVVYLLPFTFCLLGSGCIRFTGGAGVWKKGPDDEAPVTHQVGFDTNQLLPQPNQADITTAHD